VERLLQRWMIAVEPIDVSKTGMMLLNNALGALLLLPLLFAFGEAGQLGSLLHLGGRELTLVLLSCCVGMSISYAGINAQKHLTATAMLVLNNSCKFGVVAFGIVFLAEARTVQAVLGCTVALGAAVGSPKEAGKHQTPGRRCGGVHVHVHAVVRGSLWRECEARVCPEDRSGAGIWYAYK